LGRAYGFAELAGDATFLTSGIATEGVLATETRGDGSFFEGVVDCISGEGRGDVSYKFGFVVCVELVSWIT